MLILDKNGVFVMSNASFGFSDPDSGQYIDTGDLSKVTRTKWLKAQVASKVFTLVNDEGQPLEGEALQAELAKFPVDAEVVQAPVEPEQKTVEPEQKTVEPEQKPKK